MGATMRAGGVGATMGAGVESCGRIGALVAIASFVLFSLSFVKSRLGSGRTKKRNRGGSRHC